jgi:GNAT superfamily N-acetyltransferase
MRVHPANPRDLRDILRLSLATGQHSPAELEMQVTVFMQYARSVGLALNEHWWCDGDHRRTACTCVTSPGRTAMLMFPSSIASGLRQSELADFIAAVVEAKKSSDLCLLQCLTLPEDMNLATALLRAGFREIAILQYLDADLDNPVTIDWIQSVLSKQLESTTALTYEPAMRGALAELIAATYEGSLDCPSLTNLRALDDVIEGHQAAGRFDERRWLILSDAAGLIGCILMNENPLRPVLEVVYMGVHPRARRGGVGKWLLAAALELAHREGITKVTLAVDERNDPARRLYSAAGFRETMRRRALIRVLSASSAPLES